jgi:lipid-A-disaccharide synthase
MINILKQLLGIGSKVNVKELIQNELNVQNLETELQKILFNQAHKTQMFDDYNTLLNTLSKGGLASAQAAEIITDFTMELKH